MIYLKNDGQSESKGNMIIGLQKPISSWLLQKAQRQNRSISKECKDLYSKKSVEQ